MSGVDFNNIKNINQITSNITTNNIDNNAQKLGIMGFGNNNTGNLGITVQRNVVSPELLAKFENVKFEYRSIKENTDFIAENDYMPDNEFKDKELCEV